MEISGMSDASGDTHVNDARTIGAILQGAREASGESIEEVSRVLRINWRYLQALEEGQFDELPGAAYAIGFIRTYADYLNIDSADLIGQYKALSETLNTKSTLVFPEPVPESGLPGGAILFAGIVIAVVAYGGWYLATEEDSLVTRMVPPVPEKLAEMVVQDFSGDTVVVEEAAPQPAMAETPEEASAQPSEEMVEQPTDVPAPGGELAEEVSTELQTEPQDDVGVVAETTIEPVIETVTEVASSDTVKIPSVAAEEESASVPEVAVATETPSVGEENQAVVTESVQEQVVEEYHEVVAEETVREAFEGVSSDAITEEPVVDVQEAATVQEDNDALALNEEQWLAAQASIGSNEAVDGSTNDGTTEEMTAVEPVAMPEPSVPEPVVEPIVEIVAEEPTAVITDQNSDVGAGTSTTGSDDNQVVAIPVEELMRETASGRVYGDEGDVRIIVRAKTNSWIQVHDDIAGQLVLTRLLRAGDEYHVPDRDGLSLLTGNAGALEILVDGEQVPAIGGVGDVRRNVLLDADRLKSGDATSN